MKIFTIGFTKKSAETFFTTLKKAGVNRVIDVRLNNVSQLAGFSKRDDLNYFLREIVNIDYIHRPELAPTQEIIDAFRKRKGPWDDFEREFLALIAQRRIESELTPADLDGSCLLCSEETPEHCHRRLVAEYLQSKWDGVEIHHLG